LPCNAILIPRHTPLPATRTKRFVTERANQRSVKIRVLEGESCDPDACIQLGRATIQNLPPGLPAQWPIDVTFEYAMNGRLKVQAQVHQTDRRVELNLQRHGMLTPEELQRSTTIVNTQFEDEAIEELLRELDQSLPSSPAESPPSDVREEDPVPGPGAARPNDLDFEGLFAPAQLATPPTTTPLSMSPAPTQPRGLRSPLDESPWETPTATRDACAGTKDDFLPSTATEDSQASPRARASPMRQRRSSLLTRMVSIAGFVLSGLLGVVLGYWLLCIIAPRGNFLHLPLPFVPRSNKATPDEAAPAGSAKAESQAATRPVTNPYAAWPGPIV
jgi:hypothetical protein